jgi:hypothetical protein
MRKFLFCMVFVILAALVFLYFRGDITINLNVEQPAPVIPDTPVSTTSQPLPSSTSTSAPPTQISTPSFTPQPQPTSCLIASDSVSAIKSVPYQTIDLIPNAKVIWYNDFNCSEQSNTWGDVYVNPTTKISVSNSILTISTQKVENLWEGIGLGSNSLGDKKGMLMLFQYQAGTNVNLFVSGGDWQTPNYRRWGLTIVNHRAWWDGWEGSIYVGSDFPPDVLRPDTPYYLMIGLNDSGNITMKVWEKDNPNNHADFQKKMPSTWIGLPWASLLQLYEGTVEVDEYLEFSFEKP